MKLRMVNHSSGSAGTLASRRGGGDPIRDKVQGWASGLFKEEESSRLMGPHCVQAHWWLLRELIALRLSRSRGL